MNDVDQVQMLLQYQVEQFLYREAQLLDAWQLGEWLELFAEDARYTVPVMDLENPDPARDLYLVNEDYDRIQERVTSLLGKWAHAENPPSRTKRALTNVQVRSTRDGDAVDVRANFSIFRARRGSSETYVGEYRHGLVVCPNGSFRFKTRSAILSSEDLCAQGKVSIIL